MSTPTDAVTSAIGSFFSAIGSTASSAMSAVCSRINGLYNSVKSGILSFSDYTVCTLRQGCKYAADLCNSNPRITKVALGAIATGAIVAAAYAGRSYLPNVNNPFARSSAK